MFKKTLTFLALTASTLTLAAGPASAATGPSIRLDDKAVLVQGGISVRGTIKCAPGDLFREIDVTVGQDGTVSTATGGIQCDGSKQHFDVYVPGQFHPGPAKAAVVSPAPEGSNGRTVKDQGTIQVVNPPFPCASASGTFC